MYLELLNYEDLKKSIKERIQTLDNELKCYNRNRDMGMITEAKIDALEDVLEIIENLKWEY